MAQPGSADYVHVQEPAALERLVRRLVDGDSVSRDSEGGGAVALDIEADSLHSYTEKVCLLQLSFAGVDYVIDPLCGLDVAGLVEALARKRLIVHGGDYDLRMLQAWHGFSPGGEVFDTMIAARLLGVEQIGLAALAEQFLGVAMTKDAQKSDWSRRPLSEKQLRYAANDTRHLEALADTLRGELRQRGRTEWHRESCRAMVDAAGRQRPRAAEDAWRIKGAGRLTLRQLAFLREVWRWRDERARRADRPAFKVLGNRQLLELVVWAESHPDEPLEQGPKLPRDVVGARRRALRHALDRAAALPPAQWPERRRAGGASPPAIDRQRFDALRGECARIAGELKLAPSILAPKAALEAIVQQPPGSLDEVMECAGLLAWQAQLVWPVLDAARGESPPPD